MNNKKEGLRIVATALSPEFVYLIRGAGEILPDPEHFTVLWMSRVLRRGGLRLRGRPERRRGDARPRRARRRRHRRRSTGGSIATGRSAPTRGRTRRRDRYLSEEIEGLEASATMMPTIFLAVAAFVLHMLMRRLVRTQRTQIAVFRAFGYSTGRPGASLPQARPARGPRRRRPRRRPGALLRRRVLEMYREFFSFPVLEFGVDPVAVPVGLADQPASSPPSAPGGGAGGRAAAAGGGHAAGVAARSSGARCSSASRSSGRRLGFVARMIVRRLSRAKVRAAATVFGVALSVSILHAHLLLLRRETSSWTPSTGSWSGRTSTSSFHDERSRRPSTRCRRLEGVRQRRAGAAGAGRAGQRLALASDGHHGARRTSTRSSGCSTPDRGPVPLPERRAAAVPQARGSPGRRRRRRGRGARAHGQEAASSACRCRAWSTSTSASPRTRTSTRSARWIGEAGHAHRRASPGGSPRDADALGRRAEGPPRGRRRHLQGPDREGLRGHRRRVAEHHARRPAPLRRGDHLRRALQHGAHLAGRAPPRAGRAARARIHAPRDGGPPRRARTCSLACWRSPRASDSASSSAGR